MNRETIKTSERIVPGTHPGILQASTMSRNMNRAGIIVALSCVFLLLLSCGSKEKRPLTFYSGDSEEDSVEDVSYESSANDGTYPGEIISVPFWEQSGVKFVPVTVNGVGFDMILDSGCSETIITLAEANYLYNKGSLTDSDILGVSKNKIADGSIVENMSVNLKEVVIGEKILCENVQALVVENAQAPLLLGNGVLDRAASYSINNQTKTIDFVLK